MSNEDEVLELNYRWPKRVNKSPSKVVDELMNKTFNSYMNEVAAYVSKSKIKDPYTGKESYPDERLMFSIEEKMGMGDPHVDDWRRLIMAQVGSYVVRGREWRIDSNPKLHKAIEADTWDKLTKSANKILNNKKP